MRGHAGDLRIREKRSQIQSRLAAGDTLQGNVLTASFSSYVIPATGMDATTRTMDTQTSVLRRYAPRRYTKPASWDTTLAGAQAVAHATHDRLRP